MVLADLTTNAGARLAGHEGARVQAVGDPSSAPGSAPSVNGFTPLETGGGAPGDFECSAKHWHLCCFGLHYTRQIPAKFLLSTRMVEHTKKIGEGGVLFLLNCKYLFCAAWVHKKAEAQP